MLGLLAVFAPLVLMGVAIGMERFERFASHQPTADSSTTEAS